MKNIIKSLVITIVTVIGIFALGQKAQAKEITSSDFQIVDTYMKDSTTQITTYNDDSFAIIDRVNNIYEFTVCNKLGDWNYTCNNVDELNRLILDYRDHLDDNVTNTLYVTNTYSKLNGDVVTEYSDNSYTIVNSNNNLYCFFPSITTDWDIEFNNVQDMNNCVSVYKSIKENGWY